MIELRDLENDVSMITRGLNITTHITTALYYVTFLTPLTNGSVQLISDHVYKLTTVVSDESIRMLIGRNWTTIVQ